MKYFVFDTETPGLYPNCNIFDIAWVICDRNGKILERKNYLVREIMTNPKHMTRAYFAKKTFTDYIPMIDAGRVSLANGADIFAEMLIDMNRCDVIAAYNIGFDFSALVVTADTLKIDFTLPQKKILCLWNFACEVLLNNDKFRSAAEVNGWKSARGTVKTGAEVVYRYITENRDFIEDHTALSDCEIEVEILAACLRRKKKNPYGVWNNAPWRLVQTPAFLKTLYKRAFKGQLKLDLLEA